MHGETPWAVGRTATEDDMTTLTATKAALNGRELLPIALVAALGLGLLFVAGHAQSAALHDAAHDMRHATGFPCH